MNAKILVTVCGLLALAPGCGDKKEKSAGTASSASAAKATLVAPNTPIKAGQPFSITWTGPNGPDDYIDMVVAGRPLQVGDESAYVRTKVGNPAVITAPEQPGSYDVRYVQDHDGRTVVAYIPVTVVK